MSKGYDNLIEVLHEMKQHMVVRLMIVGDGPLKSELIALATSLGLKVCDWESTQKYESADIYLMGFQANAFKFYRRSKLYALSSLYEGFPNVMAEALICNIPVVSTDCYTGPREIFNVTGLGQEQTEKAIRVPAGSLLPMLDKITAERMREWIQEIKFWLETPAPPPEAFSALTERFTLKAMLEQWRK